DLIDDPDLVREYREHHRRVWPQVTAALRDIGIRRMKIYLLGTRLFMYFEAPDGFDPARDYQQYASDPRCAEWDRLMRRYQTQAPGARADEWWATMEEVCDLQRA